MDDTTNKPPPNSLVIPFRTAKTTCDQLDEIVKHLSEQSGVQMDRSKTLRKLIADAHKKLTKK